MIHEMDFYSWEKWSDRVYTITINMSTVHRITLMVFVGDEKILLIDSGHGLDANLRPTVESFAGTDKPIILACTHIGIDHAGGAAQFDEVYIHHNDWRGILKSMPRLTRVEDIQPFALYNEEFREYTEQTVLEPFNFTKVQDIDDGQIFDLGGISVEAIFTPGHSKGHMSYYCAQENVVFAGDAMNVDTHLKALDREGFLEYARMLDRFFARVDPNVRVFTAHLNRPNTLRVARNIQMCCLEIAAGQTRDDPPGEAIQKHFGPQGFNNPHKKMHYHGNCCVVYDEEKLN